MAARLWSVHSHSGQFCSHARDSLAEIVHTAHERGFSHYGLSEHMPRANPAFLYPEEIEAGLGPKELAEQFESYVQEARRLQQAYAGRLSIAVGMETEFCEPGSLKAARELRQQHNLDYIVGSVHHVDGIAIDFDAAQMARAEQQAGGPTALAVRYFEHVRTMIEALQPTVVGHFDLFRLFRGEIPLTGPVLDAALRALTAGLEHDCIFEINTSGLRKGLPGPYPHADLLKMMLERGARLTISDDAHGTAQVGTNYGRLRQYLLDHGVTELHVWRADDVRTWTRVPVVGWTDDPAWSAL
ncbi:uncharacterized protein MONBRDRAFT_16917 [Monosiga brevicollis MX1]|uniref:histidinol-phosphatase n=1 Tax=Monosiga brevicollis TaxID=81824 RepID=A9UY93_MONBE|nr:uncharacterized protein MONBRDRAFT_16917 [Monosiga brevicollis MX1]EDQ89818.1 predicted protein [Monosiga brevicollis MX1]|eukprot:XP_001745240.1 hypothetical protein [Monosiga brevicollis MX1]